MFDEISEFCIHWANAMLGVVAIAAALFAVTHGGLSAWTVCALSSAVVLLTTKLELRIDEPKSK